MEQSGIVVFSALGQATRWRAFELLVRHGADGMLQGEIAKGLGVDKNLMSTHLRILREAGLVSAEKNGREVTYRVAPTVAREAAHTILDLIETSRNSA